MTLDGTSTWVLGAPGAGPAVVVDPGPDDDAHLDAVLRAATDEHGGVACVVLTHHHADHSAGARRLAGTAAGATGVPVPVRAVRADLRVADGRGLVDGDELPCAGARLTVLATPGHTADSVCLLLRPPDGPAALLTGDTVLGRGTSVVAHPDGDLGDYLATLDRLARVVEDEDVDLLLPGHGPVLEDPSPVLAHYRSHRRHRVEEVAAAVRAGATTPAEVVAVVYPGLAPELRAPAERSAAAALALLAGFGEAGLGDAEPGGVGPGDAGHSGARADGVGRDA
ncbi:MBL fold metallo-hydrolase [Pseudokineococcus basanitobsidens]